MAPIVGDRDQHSSPQVEQQIDVRGGIFTKGSLSSRFGNTKNFDDA
jgi:hypothetical protein